MKPAAATRVRRLPLCAVGLVAAALLAAGCASAGAASRPPAPPRDSLYNPSDAALLMVAREARETLNSLAIAQVRISTVIAHAIRMGATLWVETHGECPTADEILEAHLVSESLRAEDAWDNPYVITCSDARAPVVSAAGPDGKFGTADDIVADER